MACSLFIEALEVHITTFKTFTFHYKSLFKNMDRYWQLSKVKCKQMEDKKATEKYFPGLASKWYDHPCPFTTLSLFPHSLWGLMDTVPTFLYIEHVLDICGINIWISSSRSFVIVLSIFYSYKPWTRAIWYYFFAHCIIKCLHVLIYTIVIISVPNTFSEHFPRVGTFRLYIVFCYY